MKVILLGFIGIFLPATVYCGNLNAHSSQSDLQIIKVDADDANQNKYSSSDEQVIRVIHEESPQVYYQAAPLVQEQPPAPTPETSVVRIIKEHSTQHSLSGTVSIQHQPHPNSIESDHHSNDKSNHHHHHHSEKVFKVIHEEPATVLHPVSASAIQHQENQHTVLKLIKEPVQQHQHTLISTIQHAHPQHSEKLYKIIHEEPQQLQTLYQPPIAHHHYAPYHADHVVPSLANAVYHQDIAAAHGHIVHHSPPASVIESIRPLYPITHSEPVYSVSQHQPHQLAAPDNFIFHPHSKVFKIIHQAQHQSAYPHPIPQPHREIKLFKIFRPAPIPRPAYRHFSGAVHHAPAHYQHPEQRVKIIKVLHEPILPPQGYHHQRSNGWIKK